MLEPTQEFATLELRLLELEKPALLDAFLDKIHYCCDGILACRVSKNQPRYVELDVQTGREEEVREKVDRFCTELARGAFPTKSHLVVDHRDRRDARSSVVAELLDRRWLIPYAPGCLGFQGPARALYEYLDAVVLAIARGLSAAEVSFPAIMELDTLQEAQYLASFPHHLSVAAPVSADIDHIADFIKAAQHAPREILGSCSEPTHVLAPTVCIHAYRAMRNRILQQDETVVLTAHGHCFRHERNRLDFAGRLWNFTMRELIFVGEPTGVENRRKDVLTATCAWLDQLGMAYAVETASDPFFVTGHAAQSFFQLTNRTKLELRMEVEGAELAVGSFNYHRDHFGKAFQIQQHSGQQFAHSACVGFGLERLVIAFISQLGTDVDAWPQSIRDSLCNRNLSCF